MKKLTKEERKEVYEHLRRVRKKQARNKDSH